MTLNKFTSKSITVYGKKINFSKRCFILVLYFFKKTGKSQLKKMPMTWCVQ